MKFLNPFVEQLKPYQVASHKVWEVSEEERNDLLKLDWNEGSIPPSPKVKEELVKLVSDESLYRLYPPTYSQRLMSLLSEYTGLPQLNVQYFGSSDSLQEYVSRAVLDKSDRVLVVGPTYDNFRLSAEAQGASLSFFEMEAPFEFDTELMAESIRNLLQHDGAGGALKMVYVCNPNNPTGSAMTENQLIQLVDAFPSLLFFVDEAYYEFGGVTLAPYVQQRKNLLISRTFSKAFCLAGFRIGYLLGDSELVAGISKIRNAKSITVFAQAAACMALEDIDYMRSYVQEVTAARTAFALFLNQYPQFVSAFASSGNFILMRFQSSEIKDSVLEHLSKNGIFVRNLTHSQKLDNCLRISVGTQAQMQRVMDALARHWS